MTFREKLKQDKPFLVSESYTGGCCSCPFQYGYEAAPPDFCTGAGDEPGICRSCWDREMPGTKHPADLRPCEVDGQACHFHRFIEEEQGVLQCCGPFRPAYMMRAARHLKEDGFIPSDVTMEKLRHAWALVELPDGCLKKVEPEKVRFLDREG